MTTDARDPRSLPEEGFHEIQLSGKQLVFLFMATTVVSVVIFLCGVLVGRGVRTPVGAGLAAAATSDSVADATPDEAVPSEPPSPAESTAEPPAADAQPSAPVQGQAAPGRGYYNELMTDKPAAETVKPDAPPAAAPAEEDQSRAPAPAATAFDGWVVQVTALRQRQEAQAIAARLAGRGYKAFVLDPQPGSTPLFRVRVGPFAERSEAEQIVKRLAREEQFNPWISR